MHIHTPAGEYEARPYGADHLEVSVLPLTYPTAGMRYRATVKVRKTGKTILESHGKTKIEALKNLFECPSIALPIFIHPFTGEPL